MYKSIRIAAVVILIALIPFSAISVAQSSKGYSEDISIYVAGNHALWTVTLSGINASFLTLPAGVNSYNLTAIDTSNWLSDFQIFGPSGYNVIGLPFIPSSGLFLTVNSTSGAAAQNLSSYLGSVFYTNFSPLFEKGSVYTYFAPISFTTVFKEKALSLVKQESGFASLISSSYGLQNNPLVKIGALTRNSSRLYFVSFSGITNTVLTSSGGINILTVIGSSSKFIAPSNSSSSSKIDIYVLDGIILSRDNALVTNSADSMKGHYELSVQRNQRIYSVNVTIVQQFPSVTATRIVDNGFLQKNHALSVTLTFTDLSNKTPVQNLVLNDDWYKNYSFFSLLSGNSSVKIPLINPSNSVSVTYVLNYTGTGQGSLIIPSSLVKYQYSYLGNVYNGSCYTNSVSLSFGTSGPALYATISSTEEITPGQSKQLSLRVFNVGSSPALNVSIAGLRTQTIPQGSSWTAKINVSMRQINSSTLFNYFNLSYSNPEGRKFVLSTNSLLLYAAHDSMLIPFPYIVYNGTLSRQGSSYNLTLSISVSNKGLSNASVSVTGMTGVIGCGAVKGTNITCSQGVIRISYSNIQQSKTYTSYIKYMLNSSSNIYLEPLNYTVSSRTIKFEGITNSAGFPTGLVVLKKALEPGVFPGMNTNITSYYYNSGPYSYYNFTASSSPEGFVTLMQGSTVTSVQVLHSKENLSGSYTARVNKVGKGVYSLSNTNVNFLFAGRLFKLSYQSGSINVFQEPYALVKASSSSPLENTPFKLEITIVNPSPVQVSNVQFSLPLPSGISVLKNSTSYLSSGKIIVSIPSIGASSSYSAVVYMQGGSGTSIDFSSSTLSFTYLGQSIQGSVPQSGIVISENVLDRYIMPVILALLLVFFFAYYTRKKV